MHGGMMQGTRTHLYLWPRGLDFEGSEEKRACGMVILTNGERDYQDVEVWLRSALAKVMLE